MAGTLVRPLGVLPASSRPKPIIARTESSSLLQSLAELARGVTFSLASCCRSSLSAPGSSPAPPSPSSVRNVPRSVTSSRRAGLSATGRAVSGGRVSPTLATARSSSVCLERSSSQNSTLRSPWRRRSGGGLPSGPGLALALALRERSFARFSQCHCDRNKHRDSSAIASPRPGGSPWLGGCLASARAAIPAGEESSSETLPHCRLPGLPGASDALLATGGRLR
mmetsp:Transcript_53122/g.97182  ORF Transcript_53122/g.97182 Transcript_53122/m.97182 type:complete len:224 (+) Transcript_53122:615-1286(+)